jgi:serine/threonine-protein kinase RsbT
VSRARAMEILAETDRLWASGEARRFAAALGFTPSEQTRLAICVAELASNVAKHAGSGRIELSEVTAPARASARGVGRETSAKAPPWTARGCRVRAVDAGPGIAAVEDSLRDGFSEGRWLTHDVPWRERRGLGVGLGAVCRLMSEVRVLSRPGGGSMIEAVLWRSPGPVLSNEETKTCRRS